MAAETNLKWQIINIEPDPKFERRMIVSVRFDDGNKKLGPWIQGFSLLPEKIITIEDFTDQLYTREIARPQDPYVHLKKALETESVFDLDLTRLGQ